MIAELIDKLDSFEIVENAIIAILVAEVANQMQLATDGGKDPDDWKLRIFKERFRPWEQWLNVDGAVNISPIVNVWFDNVNFDKSSSDIMERQTSEGMFNIDCYAYARSSDNQAGGHNPGDEAAALQVHRAIRLVRNILMAAENTYLQLRGLVSFRWPQSITVLQPEIDSITVQEIIGARIAFQVRYNEFSPQVEVCPLEGVLVDVVSAIDGEIILQTDYDYT